MRFDLAYAKTYIPLDVPDRNVGSVLSPRTATRASVDEAAMVREAVREPIGSPKLDRIVRPGEKIVVITSDITRPMPSYKVLPVLLGELAAAGVRREDVCIVFALGNHRGHTEAEKRQLLGEDVTVAYRCVDSDPKDVIRLGMTRRGTPVDIFSEVARADKRICLGNIEYHYFAGYSGGMKAMMPGVSTAEAIQANHRHMTDPAAHAGKIYGNPVREDMDEVFGLCPVHFIVNVVLDEKKNIIRAFAGDVFKAHREGCAFLDTMYKCPIPRKADIVVASAGGFPKDINLYQAQKALDNAKHAVKQGGIIVLLAACKEGFGEKVFERWIAASSTPLKMIADIRGNFELGGHKAAAIAMVAEQANIFLVSDLPDERAKKIFMTPCGSLAEAMEKAFAVMGEDALVHVMPFAGSTLPLLA